MEGVSPEALAVLSTVAGPQAVRPANGGDAVSGVLPALVVEPDTWEAVAASLECAARFGHSVVVRGGGTKLDWGRSPRAIDIVLSTRRLTRVLAHAHGDLTATVETGLTLETFNQELSRRGQWLPLESAFEGATIGGILATNDSGPLRHRYGTPRDLLIGIQFATTDGRLVKAGGNVVKNVAGYDLGKLLTGSWGCFAVIVAATFKLLPRPLASHTVRFGLTGPAEAQRAALAIAASPLEPAALEIRLVTAGDGRALVHLLARFASTPGAAEAQALLLERLLQGPGLASAEHFSGTEESQLWRSHAAHVWRDPGEVMPSAELPNAVMRRAVIRCAVLNVSWLPARLDSVLAFLTDLAPRAHLELIGRVGAGTGLLRVDGEAPAVIAAIDQLRPSDVFTRVTVLRSDPDLVSAAGAPAGERVSGLVRNLKQAFDPQGVLGAGRGPL